MRKNIRLWLLSGVAAFVVAGCSSLPKGGGEASQASLSIMQGVTGTGWTRINLLRSTAQEFEIQFTQEDGSPVDARLIRNTTHEFAASKEVVEEYALHGLDATKSYKMRVLDHGKLIDERNFKTLALSQNLKFVVASCADDEYQDEQKVMWSLVAAQKPNFILSIGDHPYADRFNGKPVLEAEPHMLWASFVKARQRLGLYRYKDLIPVIAVWDDHDYGMNSGDRTYAHRSEAQSIFLSFFPQRDEKDNFVRGPGIASRINYGEQRFLMLDNRSFRSPSGDAAICATKKIGPCKPKPSLAKQPTKKDPDAKKWPETHFGEVQDKWILSEIDKAGSDVVWLISGDQWFGGYSPFESFEGNYPKDFKKFMKALSQETSDSRVAFISGDRHSSEISEIEPALLGYRSFEVVASPIHAKTYGNNWIDWPNPRQKASVFGVFNFAVIESQVQDQSWKTKTTVIKYPGETAFTQDYEILRPIAE